MAEPTAAPADELCIDVLSAAVAETEERLPTLTDDDLATVEDLADALKTAHRREQTRRLQETDRA